ncbi:MAG: hypothetical protein ACRENO_00135 [Thermodesulfobacteriota bacterium]
MTNDEIWIKIKHIKQEIDLYEISNERLPLLWEEFNELYKEYHNKNDITN